MRYPSSVSRPALIALALTALSACGGGQEQSNEANQQQAMANAPEVEVLTVQAQDVPNIIEIPGRVAAVRTAEVRARVSGIIQQRAYEEGSDIAAGQILFQIDPSELRATLAGRQATLARATATLANARQNLARFQGLIRARAVSQQEYDSAVAAVRTAQADVAQANAEVRTAQLNLNYSRVVAPISGRVGRAEVTEGALVTGTEGTLLTRIEQINPVFVNLSLSSADRLALRRDVAAGRLNLPQSVNTIPVQLVLEDGTTYPLEGHIDFLDLTVNEQTGTSAFRAEFLNPQRILLPGQFVHARVQAGTRAGGIMVPQRAVTLSQQNATVMVVGENNVVEARRVTVGAMIGGNWIIQDGLRAGERVIVNGLQRVRPGAPVRIAQRPAASAGQPPANQAAPAQAPANQATPAGNAQ